MRCDSVSARKGSASEIPRPKTELSNTGDKAMAKFVKIRKGFSTAAARRHGSGGAGFRRTRAGGLGAGQAGRVRGAGRHRRRRRPDGAADPGHRHQVQADERAADRRQQVGRRRRRGLPGRQGRQGRPAQDHHHPVQPVHHAAGDRCAVQLARHDTGVDAGARPVRAVGQRGDALQDRQGIPGRRQGGRARAR